MVEGASWRQTVYDISKRDFDTKTHKPVRKDIISIEEIKNLQDNIFKGFPSVFFLNKRGRVTHIRAPLERLEMLDQFRKSQILSILLSNGFDHEDDIEILKYNNAWKMKSVKEVDEDTRLEMYMTLYKNTTNFLYI